jgi:hypothetical protein
LSGLFTGGAGALTKRSDPGEQAAGVDKTDVQIAEAHHVVAGLELGDANELIDQRFTDEDELAFPFDFTRCADTADLVIGVIPGVFLAVRHGALRGCVNLCRRSLIMGFVRALLVIMAAKDIKTSLLLLPVRCRRPRCLRLQRPMHALVPAVLLR